MKEDVVKEWIKKANADLDTVKSLLESGFSHMHIICFHCQQSIEKYFKAYLTLFQIKFEKKHDLDTLYKLCAGNDNSFNALDREQLSSLTDYAVDYRYPGEYEEPSVDEAKNYYELSKKIKEFVTQRIETTGE